MDVFAENDALDGKDIATFVSNPAMSALLARVDDTVVKLRFSEGLRRGWAPARAEASIQLAHMEAQLDGARLELADLRLATLGRTVASEESLLAALDYWKAHHWVEATWPPLNTKGSVRTATRPLPQVLAQIHKLLSARLVNKGLMDEDEVAIPVDSQALRGFAMIAYCNLPAPVRAGLLIWYAHHRPAFASNSVALARVFVRNHLVTCGFEPSGTLLTSVVIAANSQTSIMLQDADPKPWLEAYCESMVQAGEPTADMIHHVQAGVLPS